MGGRYDMVGRFRRIVPGVRVRLSTTPFRSSLIRGHVIHRRTRPVAHAFRYAVNYFLFDVDELPTLDRRLTGFGYNRWMPVCLFDSDYGRPPVRGLRDGIERFVRANGGQDGLHRIELLTQARMLGYVFNPVSYFYCYDLHDQLHCIVTEVNNTFGDRIRYYFSPENAVRYPAGHGYRQPKSMHVSPFMPMDLDYQFYFWRRNGELCVRVEETDQGKHFFTAELAGCSMPLNGRTLFETVLRFPLMPLQIVTFIHWQALRLYWKRAPFYSRPPFDERWTRIEEA